eukprot:scaffold1996_cov120-Skeletonema_dohrnii-CCMP3373.AAC.4
MAYGVAASSTSTLLLTISFVVFVIERQLACWRLGRLPTCGGESYKEGLNWVTRRMHGQAG